jgi:23S rRNA (pseudouridine1915-N3)-methyltransferase
LKLLVLSVGSPNERMAPAIHEYERRAGRYFRFESAQVAAGARSAGSPESIRAREAERLRRRVPQDLATWALSREGEELSSTDLARALSDMATYGLPGIVFLIGGAYGLASDLIRGSTRSLSVSRMTLPHEMARLVLAEQLYRAGTILRGEPYHKGGPG